MKPPSQSRPEDEYSSQELKIAARVARRARRQAASSAHLHSAHAHSAHAHSAHSAGSHTVHPRPRRVPRKSGNRWHAVVRALLLIGSGVLTLFFLTIISLVYADYRWIETQVRLKEEHLAALKSQQAAGRRRLVVLTSTKGREELLLEHGYIKPGDRILLFPVTPAEQRAAKLPRNDLASQSTTRDVGDSDASAWQRAGNALGRWWKSLGYTDEPDSSDSPPPQTSLAGESSD